MFEDSRTKVFVLNVTNGDSGTYAALKALAGSAGAFYYDPLTGAGPTFTETALATNSTQTHRFAFRNTKGVLSFSPSFKAANVKNGGYLAYAARTEQITYLGYNGTSGSLDAANSTYYGLKVVLNHTFGMLNNSPLIVTIPYKSDASATQKEVAAGLAIAGTTAFKRQAFKPLKIERVNSGAQAVALNNLAFVNGAKTFTSSDDDTLTLLVGTILRVQEPESLGAATVTSPCYVIASHDSGAGAARIYTMDQEFQGVTNADNDQCETVTEGNWGLKITGISVADANFDPINDEPFVTSFTLDASDFSTATVTYSTQPAIGTGTYQLVAAQEARAQFENKTREVSAYPRTSYNIDAIAGNTYNIFAFELWNNDYVSPTTGVSPISKNRIELAVLVGLTEAFHTVLGFGA